MAKLKALKDDKELALIPQDEPVLVELGPIDGDEGNEGDGITPALEPQPEPEPIVRTDGTKQLQEQLESAKMARAKAEQDAATERAARAKLEDDLAEARAAGADSESDAINSGLAAAQAARDAAKAALKTAYEAGDADKMADAQEQLGRAASDIREFERAAATLADRKARDAKVETDRPAPVSAPADINDVIDRMQLLPTERVWLKDHPDALLDRSQGVLLDAAYIKATKQGLSRGTAKYFEFLEKEMGYAAPDAKPGDGQEEGRTSIVAAPVSRDNRSSVSGHPISPTQVRLTPQQREMAALSGLTDTEYAQGVRQMEADKRANPEKYAQR